MGDYRVICDIFDDELVIIAIGIWHRKDNYKKKSNYV
ncbi:type II toxin-antitoxin system RelE family toxin [Streptococcus parauberis]|nr:type II toxin-antitoxin system RelE/ParE family toxin [Streptococcus parauberis]